LAAIAIKDAAKGIAVGEAAALKKKFFGLHGSDFFCGGYNEELIHAGSVAITDCL
jgi:hypothetical protein